MENIDYSTALRSDMNIADVWCAYVTSLDSSPNVNLTFTEPVYILYAVSRGKYDMFDEYYVTNFSIIFKNPSGENVTYMNVDGGSVRCFLTF